MNCAASASIDAATPVALAFHRSQIDRITLAAAHRDHQHDDFRVAHFIDEAITDTAQLDLVAIRVAVQFG